MATEILKRSEEDVLAQAPLKVKLGDKEYDVRPLRILEARVWRDKFIKTGEALSKQMSKKAGNDKQLLRGLGYTLLQFPDRMTELVFAYAPYLPKKTILASATEEQMARAFSQIATVAFPFQGELRMITQILG